MKSNTLTFSEALEELKAGSSVARKGWNGKGIFITAQIPDENSKMSQPYIYIDTRDIETDNDDAPKDCVPWTASQSDLFADDWYVVHP